MASAVVFTFRVAIRLSFKTKLSVYYLSKIAVVRRDAVRNSRMVVVRGSRRSRGSVDQVSRRKGRDTVTAIELGDEEVRLAIWHALYGKSGGLITSLGVVVIP